MDPGSGGTHDLGESGDLLRGLTLHTQGDRKASDLRGRCFAVHQRLHRRSRLCPSQILTQHKLSQSLSNAHTVTPTPKKLRRSSFPCSVRIDSGWNCTPWTGYSRCRIAMITPVSVFAVTSSESGTASGAAHSEW